MKSSASWAKKNLFFPGPSWLRPRLRLTELCNLAGKKRHEVTGCLYGRLITALSRLTWV